MSHPGIYAWQVIVEQERRHFTGSNLTFPSVPSSILASCMVQQVFAIIVCGLEDLNLEHEPSEASAHSRSFWAGTI